MGRACSARGEDDALGKTFWLENLKGGDHSEVTGLDGMILRMWTRFDLKGLM
jgi:hypothetical protein